MTFLGQSVSIIIIKYYVTLIIFYPFLNAFFFPFNEPLL